MLGVFAKLPGEEPIKSRLQARLARPDAEAFYLACLADTLETACRVVARPVLFLLDAAPDLVRVRQTLLDSGLVPEVWSRLHVESQRGTDLGARLESAFTSLCGESGDEQPSLVIGSDSPSLEPAKVRRGLDLLGGANDVVLGPTADGGYWAIGVRRPVHGLLEGIAWSTPRALAQTLARARDLGLRTALLEAWTDVDHPEDLAVLALQIAALRAKGDTQTARHGAAALQRLGLVDAGLRWTGADL